MSDVMSPASTDQALEMLMVALGYLAAADATEMTAEEQARCLKVLERATAIGGRADLGAQRLHLRKGLFRRRAVQRQDVAGLQDPGDQGRRGQPHGLDAAGPRASRDVHGDGRG
jgi:hypothetical protein